MPEHMTTDDCAAPDVRDVLPELLHGTLSGAARARAEAHVAACAACAAELALLGDAVHVLRAHAPTVDVEAIAAQVRRATRASGPAEGGAPTLRVVRGADAESGRAVTAPKVPRRAPAWRLRAAAAVALLAAGTGAVVLGRGTDVPRDAAPAPAPSAIVAAGPSGGVAAPVAPAAPLGEALADLSDEEVRLILAAVDADAGLEIEPDGAGPVVAAGGF